MKSLPAVFREEFKKNWVASKSNSRFSYIPLYQVHEQENAKVKGKGGAIGLTENQVALQRWMICEPEIAKCLSEFESEGIINESIQTDCHHEEGLATQKKFQEQVKSLLSVITTFGNPFEDNCPELLVLNSRNCVHEAVIETVRTSCH